MRKFPLVQNSKTSLSRLTKLSKLKGLSMLKCFFCFLEISDSPLDRKFDTSFPINNFSAIYQSSRLMRIFLHAALQEIPCKSCFTPEDFSPLYMIPLPFSGVSSTHQDPANKVTSTTRGMALHQRRTLRCLLQKRSLLGCQ